MFKNKQVRSKLTDMFGPQSASSDSMVNSSSSSWRDNFSVFNTLIFLLWNSQAVQEYLFRTQRPVKLPRPDQS